MRNGPSPYAVAVIRALLPAPATVPDIERRTDLELRTVLAQIHALRAADAVRAIRRQSYFTVYELNVVPL